MDVSREIIDALKEYHKLVVKWNKVMNIVSQNSVKDLWERHIIDSLQLLKFINNKDIHLVDVGSGAGFPGIVLSIAGVQKVTLIESDMKKSVFLLEASKLSNNKVEIITERIETIDATCDILTTRAFANLGKIFRDTQNIVIQDKYLLLKGENYEEELKEAKVNWSFNCNVHNSITSSQGKILEINNVIPWQRK